MTCVRLGIGTAVIVPSSVNMNELTTFTLIMTTLENGGDRLYATLVPARLWPLRIHESMDNCKVSCLSEPTSSCPESSAIH